MGKDKKDKVILALVIVILLLLGVVGYIFLVKPALSGFAVQNQNEGVQYAVLSIAQQASTCKTVSLPIGNETMDIIWVKCLQQQATASGTIPAVN